MLWKYVEVCFYNNLFLFQDDNNEIQFCIHYTKFFNNMTNVIEDKKNKY